LWSLFFWFSHQYPKCNPLIPNWCYCIIFHNFLLQIYHMQVTISKSSSIGSCK
jgi:hypothetical protein